MKEPQKGEIIKQLIISAKDNQVDIEYDDLFATNLNLDAFYFEKLCSKIKKEVDLKKFNNQNITTMFIQNTEFIKSDDEQEVEVSQELRISANRNMPIEMAKRVNNIVLASVIERIG